jgi:hypothetical protein
MLTSLPAWANQIWSVLPGSYISTSATAITQLLHTPHMTTQYRRFRDALIQNGLLQPVDGPLRVSVISTNGEIAEISGHRFADGSFMAFYIPTEDLIAFIGNQVEPSVIAPFIPVD